MVAVTCTMQGEQIQSICVCGHADSAKSGQDLVCAGVSSICVGILNAIDQMCEDTCHVSMEHGDIKINVVKDCEKTQLLLQTLLIQLLTMEESYKQFIKITKAEV